MDFIFSVKREMTEEINEPIQVIAKFKKGQLVPIRFSWRNRNYPIQRVEFIHFRNQGEAKLYFFSAIGDEANYQLIFNSQTFGWRLGKIETPGV